MVKILPYQFCLTAFSTVLGVSAGIIRPAVSAHVSNLDGKLAPRNDQGTLPFEMTFANMIKIKDPIQNTTFLEEFTNWYKNFSTERRHDEELKQLPESRALMKKYFPVYINFDCGRTARGCQKGPDEKFLIENLSSEDALYVYWIIQQYDIVIKVMLEIETQMNFALQSAADLRMSMIFDFLQQKNDDLFASCEAIQASIQAVVDTIISAAQSAGGIFVGEALDLAKSFKPLTKSAVGASINVAATAVTNAASSSLSKEMAKGGVCANFAGDFDPNNLKRFDHMGKTFRVLANEAKLSMEAKIWDISGGSYFNNPQTGPSDFADMVGLLWAVDGDHKAAIERPFTNIGREMTQRIQEAIITEAMIQTGTFILCGYPDNYEDLFNESEDSEYLMGTRYFPEDEPGKMCQGMTIKEGMADPYLLPMVGWNALNHPVWNSSSGTYVIHRSYENFKARGNGNGVIIKGEYTRSDVDTIMQWQLTSNYRVPVCDSIPGHADFKTLPEHDKSRMPDPKRVKKSFPLSCGNRFSNESEDFWKAMGYAPNGVMWSNAQDRDFYRKTLPWAMDQRKLKPYHRFQAFCAIKLSFPEDGEHAWHMQPHAHRLCGPLYEKYKDMTIAQGNYRFCTDKETKRMLKKEIWIDDPFIQKHRNQCEKWLRQKYRAERKAEREAAKQMAGVGAMASVIMGGVNTDERTFEVDMDAWRAEVGWTEADGVLDEAGNAVAYND